MGRGSRGRLSERAIQEKEGGKQNWGEVTGHSSNFLNHPSLCGLHQMTKPATIENSWKSDPGATTDTLHQQKNCHFRRSIVEEGNRNRLSGGPSFLSLKYEGQIRCVWLGGEGAGKMRRWRKSWSETRSYFKEAVFRQVREVNWPLRNNPFCLNATPKVWTITFSKCLCHCVWFQCPQ